MVVRVVKMVTGLWAWPACQLRSARKSFPRDVVSMMKVVPGQEIWRVLGMVARFLGVIPRVCCSRGRVFPSNGLSIRVVRFDLILLGHCRRAEPTQEGADADTGGPRPMFGARLHAPRRRVLCVCVGQAMC